MMLKTKPQYSLPFQDLSGIKRFLIIAHRMRTITGADKIVVLSDGIVAEQGAPEKLLNKNGIFKRMADLQLQGQNWTVR